MASAECINGMLRIDDELFYIINGLLYKIEADQTCESHDPVGALGPAYIFQIAGREIESLADKKRVLMRFSIKGSQKSQQEHMLLALAIKSKHGTGSGLINAKDLALSGTKKVLSLEGARKESEAKRNWFDNLISSTLTSGLDRDALAKIDRSKQLAVENAQKIHELFKAGFDPQNLHAAEFDRRCLEIQKLVEECEIHVLSSADLIKAHEISNLLIREGLITSAAVAASAAAVVATDGLAAPIFIAKFAKGAHLFNLSRTLMSSATAVGSLNAVVRYKEAENPKETMKKNVRNYLDGCLTGMSIGIPAAPVQQVAGLLSIEHVARFFAKTTLSFAGRNIRENGKPLPEGNAAGAVWNVTSTTALALLTQGVSIQVGNLPVFSEALAAAREQIELCNKLRLQGGADAEVIAQLEQQALLKLKILEYMLGLTKSSAKTVSVTALPAVPDAFERERKRISEKLGKENISNEELLQNLNFKSVLDYASESMNLPAIQASVLSQVSTTKKDVGGVLSKVKKVIKPSSSRSKRPPK